MRANKSGDMGGRYSEICGATNNRGDPCKLPAGWGTPGSGGTRCKFHGGGSTGPKDTEYLKDNSHAKGNSGGGAPEGNTNAEIHGGFSDWRKAYERFDGETKEFVDKLVADMRETAKEHASDVATDRRERLLKEKATLSILYRRASVDILPNERARGIVIEDTEKVNPVLEATHRISTRQREIAEELSLWPGFQ